MDRCNIIKERRYQTAFENSVWTWLSPDVNVYVAVLLILHRVQSLSFKLLITQILLNDKSHDIIK